MKMLMGYKEMRKEGVSDENIIKIFPDMSVFVGIVNVNLFDI